MRPRASRAAAKASSVSAKTVNGPSPLSVSTRPAWVTTATVSRGAGADGDVDNGAGTFFLFGHVIVGHLVVAWLGGVGGLDASSSSTGSSSHRRRRRAKPSRQRGVAGNAWGIFLVQGKGGGDARVGYTRVVPLTRSACPRMHSGCEVDAVCVDLMSAAFGSVRLQEFGDHECQVDRLAAIGWIASFRRPGRALFRGRRRHRRTP